MGSTVGWRLDRDEESPGRRDVGAWRFCRFGYLVIALILPAALIAAVPARALDGVVGARGNRQEGRAGAYAYSSDQLFLNSSIEERARLAAGLGLRLSYLVTWEDRTNEMGGLRSEYDQWLGRPQASLNYAGSNWRCGWTGSTMRTEQRTDGLRMYRDDRYDHSVHLGLELGRGNLEARWQGGAVERRESAGERRNTDQLWHTNAQYRLTDSDQVQYGYSRSGHDAETLGVENIYDRHHVELQGHRGFADGRGRVNWSARTTWFRQRTRTDVDGVREFVQPYLAGYRLDDTPGYRDPLEAEPVEIPSLADNVYDTSTGINLGDSGPLVREFGGDFCNLFEDFGDAEEIVAARLYIDRRPVLPGLFQWQVYLNDDPDGRDWGEPLSADQVSIVFREWEDGRRGWDVEFTDPVSARRVALVDTKLGATEPEIYVTELEFYRWVPASLDESEITSRRHRFSLASGYEARGNLHFDYGVVVDLRRFEDEARASTSVGQNAGFDWIRSGWILAGSYQDSRRDRETGTDTEINSQTLSLAPVRRGEFHTRLAASRSQDLSYGRDQTTWNLSGDATWQAAPRLTMSQRVTWGLRDDDMNDVSAHSWALVSRVRSAPRRTLRLDLTRRDRWVSEEAGDGFMGFNDTEVLVAWSITSQITASSRVRYQERDQGEWVLRHFFSWSPIPGGNLEMRLYLNGYRDTRNDSSQVGQGVSVTWQPRSRLHLEGGYNVSEYHQADSRSSPTNLNFRGTWTF